MNGGGTNFCSQSPVRTTLNESSLSPLPFWPPRSIFLAYLESGRLTAK
uniref:Uncharacterized protein n=1 Tax=Ascaris lumbricoides TaxID=6252 RepID=A0A0M3IMX3_ASCLU